MKVAAIAALNILFALSGEAVQSHRQTDSAMATCDNDGHGATLNTTASSRNYRKSESKIKNPTAAPRHPARALDANGNAAAPLLSLPNQNT